jgi:uncharacterized protein YigA (DUF484 family)
VSSGAGKVGATKVGDDVLAQDWVKVRAWLLDHPDRLRDDQALLDELGLKYTAPNVVEFLPAALARLEAAHARELTARQEIEALAKANFDAQAQTHDLIIDLLEARSNTDLARRVDQAARERFGLVGGLIAVETPDAVGTAPAGWKPLPTGVLDLMMGPDRQTRMGPCPAARELFDPGDPSVQSCALVRLTLWSPERQGVLAFGSADPEGFTPDMGPELVSFLARVVERTAARWPNL